jgi:invasion protein IalB
MQTLTSARKQGLGGRLLAAILVALALCGRPNPAVAQGTVRATFGDWQIRCEKPPGSKDEECKLYKSVASDNRPNAVLHVLVFKSTDKKYSVMRILTPPGVELDQSLGLTVDDTPIGRVQYKRCVFDACLAESIITETLLTQLRTGRTAWFHIFFTPEDGVSFPVDLKGFSEGFDKLP